MSNIHSTKYITMRYRLQFHSVIEAKSSQPARRFGLKCITVQSASYSMYVTAGESYTSNGALMFRGDLLIDIGLSWEFWPLILIV